MTKLEQNSVDLQAILDEVNALPIQPDITLQTKTVTPTTSEQTVTPDAGCDGFSSVTVKAMPTAPQATPRIYFSASDGYITANATQSAGYVAAGTTTATKQLTVQAAKTITPSTSSQTAVAAGRYTTGAVTVAAIPSTYVKPTATKAATTYTPTTSNQTIAAGTYCSGAQTIKGDVNLVAGNIKSGVSIFGVTGTYAGTTEDLDAVISELENKTATLNTTLEGKASGGGGGSVETCTVTISDEWGISIYTTFVSATVVNDGNIEPYIFEDVGGVSKVIIPNVVCGSSIYVDMVGFYNEAMFELIGDITLTYVRRSNGYAFCASQTSGAECTIIPYYEP